MREINAAAFLLDGRRIKVYYIGNDMKGLTTENADI